MKICTITCQNADNYGARLQTYALATYLEKKGHEVKVIDYRPSYMSFKVKEWYWPGCSIKNWAKLFLQLNQRNIQIKRHKMFDRFSQCHIPLTPRKYHSWEDLFKRPPEADIYIAGSDQIWNTFFPNGKDPAFYLDFGDTKTKRISYAASFATTRLAEDCADFVQRKVMNLDHVSVRENSGLAILQELGCAGKLAADPACLLSSDQWDEIAVNPQIKNDYILVYDFLNSPTLKKLAIRLTSLLKCKISSVGPRRLKYADKNLIYASPEEFVGLVKNARCVISNSFHGTMFAMIYHRDFFVVKREDGLNERMVDLLGRYRLSHRLVDASVSDAVLSGQIDYQTVKPSFDADIKSSEEFLALCL